jgi:hypothetical protein
VVGTTAAAMIAMLVGKSRLRRWLSRWLGYFSAMRHTARSQIEAPQMYSQIVYGTCVEFSAR